MRFAVTGGAGFIGSSIVRLLVANGHDVIVVDNQHTGTLKNLESVKNEIEFKNIDIRDFHKLDDAISNVEGIFHEAALTIVEESFEKPDAYNDVNVIGTENVFKIAKKNDSKVVYASSSSVYGDCGSIPIQESAPTNPINPYAITKLKAEKIAKKYMAENVRIVGLRYFNVYGLGQTGSYAGVITKFMSRLEGKRPPVINGTGNQTRDFVYVEDVALSNIAAMNSDVDEGFFNIGTGRAVSIKQLAKTLIKEYGLTLKAEFADPLSGDVKDSMADIRLATKKLLWTHKTRLEDGLRKII